MRRVYKDKLIQITETQEDWYIEPGRVRGRDYGNSGHSEQAPLATFAEFMRRIGAEEGREGY